MPPRPALALALAFAAPLLAAPPAAALPPVKLRQQYEEALVARALRRAGLERDPHPEGKRIERVVIVREDIIGPGDPWPAFLNWVHVKTRDYIVRQELLVGPGDRWDADLVAESERNLRAFFILAVARAVPARASRPDHVVLLVVTKDLWSLRLNMVYRQTGAVVHLLDFLPTEENFLGRNKRVSLHLRVAQLDLRGFALRDHLAVGQQYFDRRLLGSRWQLFEAADLFIDGDLPCGGRAAGRDGAWCRAGDAGRLAGGAVRLTVQRPLFSLATRWAAGFSASVSARQVRVFQERAGSDALALETVEFRGRDAALPWVYDSLDLAASAWVTRSHGRALKHDLTLGAGAYRQRYDAPAGFAEAFAPDLVREYLRQFVPRSESALFVSVRYDLRPTRFARLRNVETFALSEDLALGPSASLRVAAATSLDDGGQPFVTFRAAAGYTLLLGGDILQASVRAATRWQPRLLRLDLLPDLDDRVPWANTELSATLRNVTPVLLVGRLHTRVALVYRHNDLERRFLRLGGASLRGYPDGAFTGRNLLRVNAELRSLPINLLTLHLGFVLFYDGGAAFGGPDRGDRRRRRPFRYRHSVGLGLRALFPQFDRETLRVDLGFPLSGGAGSFGTWFSLSFGQAF